MTQEKSISGEDLEQMRRDSADRAAQEMNSLHGRDPNAQMNIQMDEILGHASQQAKSYDSLFVEAIGPMFLLPEGESSVKIRFNTTTAVRPVRELPWDKLPLKEDRTEEQIKKEVAYLTFKRQWALVAEAFQQMLSTKASLVDIDCVLPDDIDYKPYFHSDEVNVAGVSGSKNKADVIRTWLEVAIGKMVHKSGYLEAHKKAFDKGLTDKDGKSLYVKPTVSILTPYNSVIGPYLFENSSIEVEYESELDNAEKLTVNFIPVLMMGDHDYFAIFHAGEQEDVNLQAVYSMGVLARRPSLAIVHGQGGDRHALCGLSAAFFPINPVVHHFKIDERL